MSAGAYRLTIAADLDATLASMQARRCALALGFGTNTVALLATAVSELGTNIIKYAGRGEIAIEPIERDGKRGLQVRAIDNGPGIADIDAAMQDHHSTGGTLGLGLSGVKRMMDEFEIRSQPQRGTSVVVIKWK